MYPITAVIPRTTRKFRSINVSCSEPIEPMYMNRIISITDRPTKKPMRVAISICLGVPTGVSSPSACSSLSVIPSPSYSFKVSLLAYSFIILKLTKARIPLTLSNAIEMYSLGANVVPMANPRAKALNIINMTP